MATHTKAYTIGQGVVALSALGICCLRERRTRLIANIILIVIGSLVLGPLADAAMREQWLDEAYRVRDALAAGFRPEGPDRRE